MLHSTITLFTSRWVLFRVSVHVDDISLMTGEKNANHLPSIMAKVVADLVDSLAIDLQMSISLGKTTVLSSNPSVAVQISQALGTYGGKHLNACTRLGLDHTHQLRRSHVVINLRLKKAGQRHSKVLRLKHKKLQAKVVLGALLPSVLYGLDTSTPSLSVINTLRSWTVSALGLRPPGTSIDKAALLLQPHQDPLVKSLEAPLVRWTKELWYSSRPSASHKDVVNTQVFVLALQQVMPLQLSLIHI